MAEEERPIAIEIDASTGIQTERPLTDEEWDHSKAMQAHAAAEESRRADAMAATEVARVSAREKLAALGLSEAEIDAMSAAPLPPEGAPDVEAPDPA